MAVDEEQPLRPARAEARLQPVPERAQLRGRRADVEIDQIGQAVERLALADLPEAARLALRLRDQCIQRIAGLDRRSQAFLQPRAIALRLAALELGQGVEWVRVRQRLDAGG